MAENITVLIEAILKSDQFKTAMKQVKSETDAATKSVKDQQNILDTLKSKWLLVAGAVAGALGTVKKAFDFAKEFSEFQESTQAMERQFGVSSDVVIAKLKEASGGMLSMKDSVIIANKAMTAGITNVDTIANLYKIAKDRAEEFGIDATDAYDKIVTGLMRGTPKQLQSLGFQVDGWQKLAKAQGEVFDSQYMLNQVLKEGQNVISGGKGIESYADKFDRLSATMADFKLKIGGAVVGAFAPMADAVSELLSEDLSLEGSVKRLITLNQEYASVTEVLKNNTDNLTASQKTNYESQAVILEGSIRQELVNIANKWQEINEKIKYQKTILKNSEDDVARLKKRVDELKGGDKNPYYQTELDYLNIALEKQNKSAIDLAAIEKERASSISLVGSAMNDGLVSKEQEKVLGKELVALAKKESEQQNENEARLERARIKKKNDLELAEKETKRREKEAKDIEDAETDRQNKIKNALGQIGELERMNLDPRIAKLQIEIETTKQLLEQGKLTEEQRKGLEQVLKLTEQKLQMVQNEISMESRKGGSREGEGSIEEDPEVKKIMTKQEKQKEWFNLVQVTESKISDIVSTHTQRELLQIDNKMNAELLRAKAKGASETELAKIEEKYAKQNLKERQKGAKAAKAANLLEAITNTSAGVSRAFKDYAMPWALIPAAAVGIAGGVQIGKIASEPIPEFAAGGRPQGLSLVGERGPELFVPDSPGTIIPNHILRGISVPGGMAGSLVNDNSSVTTSSDTSTKVFNFYGIQDIGEARNALMRKEGKGAFA